MASDLFEHILIHSRLSRKKVLASDQRDGGGDMLSDKAGGAKELNEAQLGGLIDGLGGRPSDLLRKKEGAYTERGLTDESTRAEVIAAILAEPILLDKLQSGFFGDLLEVHVNGLSGGYDPDAPLHWRQRRELSGQNIMATGIFNETVRRYAGHEKSIMAHGKIFTGERVDAANGQKAPADVFESLGVIAELESGATAVYHVSSVAKLGPAFAFSFYGTKGSFKMEAGNALSPGGVWIAGEGDTEYQPLELAEHPRNGWQVEEDFVAAIRDGR